ncbi:hypothetical protein NDU88_009206 [Pleurodeles waltl]|uniref:Uncharacterized protein n=1 Tax=Pleurodeles waltl TaxID=8319 RepID=A0AAV7RXP7_PLEWA|nr:hypothetical protein NDU88_009206 [Pleurodeles waltl]
METCFLWSRIPINEEIQLDVSRVAHFSGDEDETYIKVSRPRHLCTSFIGSIWPDLNKVVHVNVSRLRTKLFTSIAQNCWYCAARALVVRMPESARGSAGALPLLETDRVYFWLRRGCRTSARAVCRAGEAANRRICF